MNIKLEPLLLYISSTSFLTGREEGGKRDKGEKCLVSLIYVATPSINSLSPGCSWPQADSSQMHLDTEINLMIIVWSREKPASSLLVFPCFLRFHSPIAISCLSSLQAPKLALILPIIIAPAMHFGLMSKMPAAISMTRGRSMRIINIPIG